VIDEGRRTRWTIFAGGASPISGGVQETERPLNEHRDEISPEVPESYTFEQLGLSESDTTYGLSFEHQWRWVTFFANLTRLESTADGVAPEDLYIGVSSIRFEGREYDYQKLPEGEPYRGSIDLYSSNLRIAFTPWTFNAGGSVEFVPWVSLGLYLLGGEFVIDAGPAQDVVLFEFPPREYVVGGRGEGTAAALAPELGIGGELTFWLGERSRLVLQGNLGWSDISASTSDLGVDSRNEKDISLEFNSIDARALFEFPIGETTNLLVGAEFRSVEIDALAEAKDRSIEEIFELQEKFNKKIDLSIESLVLSVGLRF